MPELDSGCQKVQAGNEEESPDPVQIMDGGKELSPPLTREISQPPTVDVNQASPPDKLISKKALVEVLKEIVKDGVNVESVFTNATRNELQRCRAETKRGYWYKGRAINAFFDMGHIKDEYTIRFAEKAIDDSLR